MMKEGMVRMMGGNSSTRYSLKDNAGMLQTGWNYELELRDVSVRDSGSLRWHISDQFELTGWNVLEGPRIPATTYKYQIFILLNTFFNDRSM